MRLVILALDTATDVTTVGLAVDGRVYESAAPARPHAAQRVLVDVAALLDSAGLAPDRIEQVVVGTGPGGYTGLRIGIACGLGLAAALGIPVGGVSTLHALLCGDGVELALIDARRGQVFVAGGGLAPCVVAPAELPAMVERGLVAAGDGAVRHRDLLTGLAIPPDESPLHIPWARHHAALAATAGAAEPQYLRAPDVDRRVLSGAAR